MVNSKMVSSNFHFNYSLNSFVIEMNFYRPHTKYREGYVFSVSVLLFTGGGPGKCTLSTFLRGGVSGKVHSEHILGGGGGGVRESAL